MFFSKTKRKIIKFVAAFVLGVFFFVPSVHAASIFLSPSSGEYFLSKNITVSVLVSSADQALNAVSGTVVFPADKLEVVSVSKTSSIINFWVNEPSFSNKAGTVNFEGVVLNPGFKGNSGKIVSVTFKTKSAGTAAVKLTGAQILANDGLGTNITKGVSGASFVLKTTEVKEPVTPTVPTTPVVPQVSPEKIAAEKTILVISSDTHPDQTKWYNNNSLEFSWAKVSGVTAVKLSLSKVDERGDGKTYAPAVWEKKIDNIDDGVYNFYVQPKVGQYWGKESFYKVQIDTVAPTDLVFNAETDGSITLGAADSGSGVEKYVIRFVDGESYEIVAVEGAATNTTLPTQFSGKEVSSLEAFDRAGNSNLLKVRMPVVQKAVGPQVSAPVLEIIKGNILSISGKSGASAKVVISVEYKGKTNEYETIADASGNFVYVWDTLQNVGVYKIWAQELSSAGVRGDSGNQIFVAVTQTKLMRTLRVLLEYTAIIALILSVVVIFLALVAVVFRRVFRRNIQ